jgi:hypothetical protein
MNQSANNPNKVSGSKWNFIWVAIGALLVWFGVAVVVGRIIIAVFPPRDPNGGLMWLPLGQTDKLSFGIGLKFPTANGSVPVGIDLRWWNLPGTVLGALVAFLIVRGYFRPRSKGTSP